MGHSTAFVGHVSTHLKILSTTPNKSQKDDKCNQKPVGKTLSVLHTAAEGKLTMGEVQKLELPRAKGLDLARRAIGSLAGVGRVDEDSLDDLALLALREALV